MIDHSGKYLTTLGGGEMQTEMTMTQRAVEELSTFNELIVTVIPYGELTVSEDGIGKVEEAYKAVKRLSASIEKKRKELKADALEYGRTVDSIAKQLSEKVDGVEAKFKAERDAFDAVEKAEKAAKEQAKQAAKQARINEMVANGIAIDWTAAELPEEEWMWWLSKAKKEAEAARAEADRIKAEQEAETKRQAEAAELQRKIFARTARMEALGVACPSPDQIGTLSDEQFEHDYKIAKSAIDRKNAALKAEQEAEAKRQAEELRIRAEEIERQQMADEAAMADRLVRLKAEREAFEAKQAEERKAMEAEREAIRKQQEELAKVAKAKEEAERQAAETKARAEREAAEAARLEALKPEIEKARLFAQMLTAEAAACLNNLGLPDWSDDALAWVNRCGQEIVSLVEQR